MRISLPPDANLTMALLPHGPYYAIEPLAGMHLLEMLRSETVSQHLAAYQARMETLEAEAAGRVEASKDAKPFQMVGNVALFSVVGPMTKAPTSMSAGTSTVRYRRQVRQAMDDPDVAFGVTVFDTPGGSVAGTADAAADIAAFAAKKPMIAFVEDCCCSAGYWLASQCAEIVINRPTAVVGSIGTIMVAYDQSRMYQNAGVEPVVFGTGAMKGAGSAGTEITAAQRAYFQQTVADMQQHFRAAVQSGRGLSDEQMDALSDARIHVGQAAIDMGLADRIASLDDVLAGLQAQPAAQSADW